MAIKVGLNGFGRIGRVVFRTCLQNPELQISAINDPAVNAEYVCYLIKFDSTHGKFKGSVTYVDDEIIIDGHHIRLFHEKLPANIPWVDVGVQYVVEASGMFTSLEKASGHLASEGVKRVILTSPSVDVPMIIKGVNDNRLKPVHKVISCASSTLYCLAPIIKVLEDHFGVAEGFVTSIHALTPSLKPLDGLCLRGKHWRDHRSIHQNIIPASTGACKALGKIIPRIRDKLTGLAFRVPIVNVSVLDLSIRLNKNTILQDIIKAVENVSKSSMKNIIKISNDQAVSSDFLGDSHSCIFDVDSSIQLKPDFYKIICWYENEYSYACRIIDSILFSESQFLHQILSPNTISVRSSPYKAQDRGSKEFLSSCSCNDDISNNNTLSSSSQDTGFKKKACRPVFIKKPTSSYTSQVAPLKNNKAKKGNEIFKIWNDIDEPATTKTKQNRNAFFQSVVFSSQSVEKTECIMAQERLQNVKKEFCKMVNITENLLKMSCSSKFKLSSLVTTSDSVNCAANVETMSSSLEFSPSNKEETFEKTKDEDKNELLSDECDDCKDTFGVTDIVVKKCSNQEVIHYDNFRDRDTNLSDSIIIPNILCGTNINKGLQENKLRESSLIKTESYEQSEVNTELSTKALNFKEQVTKTVVTLIDGICQNMNYPHVCNHNKAESEFSVITCDTQNDETDNAFIKITESDETKVAPEQNTLSTLYASRNYELHIRDNTEDTDKPEKYEIKDLAKYLHRENYNMQIIDEELKKRNIILVTSQKYDTNSQIFKSCTSRTDMTAGGKVTISSEKILESLNHVVNKTVIKVAQDTSACDSQGNIITICDTNNKQDIFDKLDSASGTGSESSFEINGKKSQVLQITDLSSSVEDLARLDKICRIIEISDELSDKLFSGLDNGVKMHNTKWSFKELCEKIKLDDFCNKVFGK